MMASNGNLAEAGASQLEQYGGIEFNISDLLRDMENQEDDDVDVAEVDDDPDQFPDPVVTEINRVQVRFPGDINPSHDEIMEAVLFNILNGKNGLIECPSEGDRRLGVLTALLAYCCRNHDMEMGNRNNATRNSAQEVPLMPGASPTTKIFYGTKSFEEIEVVIDQLKKFKKTGYLNAVQMHVVAPHDKLCEGYVQGAENSACAHPGPEANFAFIEPTTGTVHSIQDLALAARRSQFCGYYFCKNPERIKNANIVLCAQEFILSPFLREVYGIDLNQAIVVFDDGSNIETACCNQGSLSISTTMLNSAAERLQICLNALNEEDPNAMSPERRRILDKMKSLGNCLTTFSETVRKSHLSNPREEITLQILRDNGLGQNEVNLFLIRFRDLLKLTDSLNGNAKLDKRTFSNISKILTILKVIFDLHTGNHPYQHDISLHTTDFRPRPNVEPVITFTTICSTAKIMLQPIMDAASSVIIGSGCLPSKQVLRHELEVEENRFTEQVAISVHTTNCFYGYCGVGPHGVNLDFNFNARDRSTVIEEAGEAVRQICKAVPYGVVVFFPSEYVLKNMIQCWGDGENRPMSILDEIKITKHVFSELKCKVDSDVPREIEKFSKRCLEPLDDKTGAIFFALHRGKVNNRMDFKNNEVKMIVSCGLPYSAYGALQATQKRNHYQAIYLNNKKLSDRWSRLWYNAEMFHILCQTLAHCVRNGQNWVGGIVLDSRMPGKQGDLGTFIPRWILKDWKGYPKYEGMMKGLNDFVSEQNSMN